AIDPLISWSKYQSFIDPIQMKKGHQILQKSNEVSQMMKVIGEEGTSLGDFITYLKGEFFDFIYLQQNAYDVVDESSSAQRQKYVFNFIYQILESVFDFESKDKARHFFQRLRQQFRGWNSAAWDSLEFKEIEIEIRSTIEESKVKNLNA
ncbi:MAG: V-type ATP synthase subunit A, partial [Candidatus Omnitrophica bacterium]|nr:V-type ATP synthase subunit A [Candidatus Omnitrophota bacterium]